MRKLSVVLLAVVMSVMMVVPAFAQNYDGHELPSLDSYNEPDFPYVVITYNEEFNKYRLVGSLEPFVFKVSDSALVYADGAYKKTVEYSVDGDVWDFSSFSNLKSIGERVIYTTYNIYDTNGNLYLEPWVPPVPPKPLAESIIELAGDTINKDTVPSVSSAMTILCVTGVGLLAMLVLLKLFGKRSLIHR